MWGGGRVGVGDGDGYLRGVPAAVILVYNEDFNINGTNMALI